VSPDGSQIVANRAEGALWIYSYSLIRRTAPRQLATPGSSAVWTPDGKRITFRAGRSKSKPTEGMFSQRADGIGSAELLLSVDGRPVGWSRDGTTLFYISERQLWSWRRGEKPRSLLRIDSTYASLSPDRQWVAYHTSENGPPIPYVQSLSKP